MFFLGGAGFSFGGAVFVLLLWVVLLSSKYTLRCETPFFASCFFVFSRGASWDSHHQLNVVSWTCQLICGAACSSKIGIGSSPGDFVARNAKFEVR